METLNNIGIVMMAIATLSLLGLAIEAAIRHGGEGILMALGLASGAIVPAWTGMAMADVNSVTIAMTVSIWISIVLVILAIVGLILLWQRQREGFICLGLSLFLGAAVYAIAPGYITAVEQEQPATQSS